jgi:gluconolactonase
MTSTRSAQCKVLADDLWFPEGPVELPDGSIALVEIRRQTVTIVERNGSKRILAHTGGGPNGLALGPDGYLYVCNNGGFKWAQFRDVIRPVGQPDDYSGGRIERIDLNTGKVERLYDKVNGIGLRGPNDIVFDAHGGFWFTDLGKSRPREIDYGGLYYAKADGSSVTEVVHPLWTANGVGLSPDGNTVYAVETRTARLWAWDVVAPGQIAPVDFPSPNGGRLIYTAPEYVCFDSLALDAAGNINLATFMQGGITVVSPKGELVEFARVEDDWFVTNICFGGPQLGTAFITSSGKGRLLETVWPRPGLALNSTQIVKR